MSEEQARAIFTLAGIQVLNLWELANRYWPTVDAYLKIRAESPWWLVKTPFGLIMIGWRKRVINIDWSDTSLRVVVTKDDVTKDETHVHAWEEVKAVEYLKALARFHRAGIVTDWEKTGQAALIKPTEPSPAGTVES